MVVVGDELIRFVSVRCFKSITNVKFQLVEPETLVIPVTQQQDANEALTAIAVVTFTFCVFTPSIH